MATQIQASLLNMFQTTGNQIDLNAVVFFAIPGFRERYDEFSGNMDKMFGLNEELSTDKSGASTELTQLKSNLIDTGFSIASKVTAYALTKKDVTLYNEMNYSITDLKKKSYQNLLSLCEVIYSRALALGAELEPFNVTSDRIDRLKLLVEKCRKAVPIPRENINQQSTSGKSMSQLFKTNLVLLDEMDTLSEVIKESNESIYASYKKARKIIKLPSRHRTVVGKITNAGGTIPIKNAIVNFYVMDDTSKMASNTNGSKVSEKPVLTKKSAKKGGFNVDSLPDGMYRVEIVKTGFQTLIVTIAVTNAEMIKMVVEMEKV